eukprot:scaffold8066_cov157-Isochrysis_galbana.AAC.1
MVQPSFSTLARAAPRAESSLSLRGGGDGYNLGAHHGIEPLDFCGRPHRHLRPLAQPRHGYVQKRHGAIRRGAAALLDQKGEWHRLV